MIVEAFFERLAGYGDAAALVCDGQTWSYARLLERVDAWCERLRAEGLGRGDCVAFIGDYAPDTAALLLALIKGSQIAVPLTEWNADDRAELLDVARVTATIDFSRSAAGDLQRHQTERHPLFDRVATAGMVVFTTGSTGKSKAVLHDAGRLLGRYGQRRPGLRSIAFLLLDHLGGINTLLHLLSNGGTAITVESRDPEGVCRAIEEHRAELLPASPTFLNMLLMSRAYEAHDLSSLQIITYGTEPMPETTLRTLRDRFPVVKAKQTYGLTELGVFPTRSRDDDSLWFKLAGPGVETQVQGGTLCLRSATAMLGYLNAPDPFDADGWYDTQDEVEVDGEYIRILGRRKDTINVGGQKVYPAAVENVLLQMSNVADAEVYGRNSPVTGKIVAVRLSLHRPEAQDELLARLRQFCHGKLKRHEIPLWLDIVDAPRSAARFKKLRGPA